jgi:excisionase family DNA binding protein
MTHCGKPFVPLSERLGYDVGETAALINSSVSFVYELIRRGELETVKVGGRRIAALGARGAARFPDRCGALKQKPAARTGSRDPCAARDHRPPVAAACTAVPSRPVCRT